MEDSFEFKNDNIIKKNNNNPFITFIKENFGYFKQFLSKEETFNIGKINRKLMSLLIIDIGNNLYNQRKNKVEKLEQIISVSF